MKLLKALATTTLALASSASFAAPALYFLVDGNTFTEPFSITNQSTQGERVTRFQLNLATTGMVFDTADFGAPGNDTQGVPFTPVGSDAALTGLVAGGNPADGSTVLDVSFDGFDAAETFRWNIDIDGANGSQDTITVMGNQLIGSSVSIWFSTGERLFGSLVAVDGSPLASQLFITGRDAPPSNGTPEPGSLALAGLALLGLGAARRAKRS